MAGDGKEGRWNQQFTGGDAQNNLSASSSGCPRAGAWPARETSGFFPQTRASPAAHHPQAEGSSPPAPWSRPARCAQAASWGTPGSEHQGQPCPHACRLVTRRMSVTLPSHRVPERTLYTVGAQQLLIRSGRPPTTGLGECSRRPRPSALPPSTSTGDAPHTGGPQPGWPWVSCSHRAHRLGVKGRTPTLTASSRQPLGPPEVQLATPSSPFPHPSCLTGGRAPLQPPPASRRPQGPQSPPQPFLLSRPKLLVWPPRPSDHRAAVASPGCSPHTAAGCPASALQLSGETHSQGLCPRAPTNVPSAF